MDEIQNPYKPGAGTQPSYLAGRESILHKANVSLERTKIGNYDRAIMLYGLRGVGKTVLLNRFKQMAEQKNYICEKIEISENDKFQVVITSVLRKILLSIDNTEKIKETLKKALGVFKSFSVSVGEVNFKLDVKPIVGQADSGRFEDDLKDIFLAIGEAAKAYNKYICILVDEIQYLKKPDLGAFIAALHQVAQSNLPIIMFGAGLPSVQKMTGDVKTYAERLFVFQPVENLKYPENEKAITEPAKKLNVTYNQDAIDKIIEITKGYPYFIQELGRHIWDVAKESPITLQDVLDAEPKAMEALDESFFKSRLDKVTDMEKSFMHAMASMGDNEKYAMADIVKKMGRKSTNDISIFRDNLKRKGVVDQMKIHGYICFTVPLFADFLRRTLGDYKPKLNKPKAKK